MILHALAADITFLDEKRAASYIITLEGNIIYKTRLINSIFDRIKTLYTRHMHPSLYWKKKHNRWFGFPIYILEFWLTKMSSRRSKMILICKEIKRKKWRHAWEIIKVGR